MGADEYRLTLKADGYTISASTGGTVNFILDAGLQNANRNYILLGSVSGVAPGTPLPGGQATLPLNWDVFTNTVIDLINTLVFQEFMGQLDENGQATATLNAPPIPGFAGTTIHFAYCCNNPFNLASNPIEVEIIE